MTLEEMDDVADHVQSTADFDPFQHRGSPCWLHSDGNWIAVLAREEGGFTSRKLLLFSLFCSTLCLIAVTYLRC